MCKNEVNMVQGVYEMLEDIEDTKSNNSSLDKSANDFY